MGRDVLRSVPSGGMPPARPSRKAGPSCAMTRGAVGRRLVLHRLPRRSEKGGQASSPQDDTLGVTYRQFQGSPSGLPVSRVPSLESSKPMRMCVSTRTAIALSLVLSVTSLGCTHTQTVHTNTKQFAELQQTATNERVTVTLADRRSYQGVEMVELTSDSASWRGRNETAFSVPTSEVFAIRIEKKNRGRGALEGFGLGLLGGGLLGAFVGLASDPGPYFTTGESMGIAATGIGALGGLVGILIGAVDGSKKAYRIESSSPPSPASTAPVPTGVLRLRDPNE